MRRTLRLRTAAAATVAAALATGLAACGGAQVVTQQKSPEPIHIGAIYNLAGSQAALDGPSLDGARLAVDRINAAGGLLGRRVELMERDGQTDAALIRYDAESLAALKVTAMIGLSDTDQVLAAAPIAARAGIPFVTSGATSPRLPARVPDWLFLACFGDNVQAAAGAEFAADWLGARTAAVLFDTDMDYARLLQRYFGQAFRAQGGKVVLRAGFHSGEHDVAKLLAPLAGEGGDESDHVDTASAELLFVAASPDDAGPLVRRLRAAGYRQPIMGGDSFDSGKLIEAARKTGGGVYFTTHAAFGLAHSTAAMRRFTTWYRSAYGRPPENAFAGLGFDAVNLVAGAIRRAKSADPRKVRDALLETRGFSGVSGGLSYAGGSLVPRKAVSVILVDNKAELAAQITPSFVPAP
ncbi:MAG: ABC transporter substrate-binding protein [Actinobacteria bacterium]|nr:ABC transporter substrate-binding protein [Actinomycetota bacterium]